MKELIVRIKHDNDTAQFSAFDVKEALENIFALGTNFEVEEISPPETING
ncbi:MAG: hypothetical protein ABII88_06020 [Candidatus Omnitrophota bacterium]